MDNQPLARQKRRRTSSEDQAILEAEYEKNSKPDKSARMDIVKRVALGEKEVQIWFQNRRQMTRRKSRHFSSQDSGVSDMFSSQNSTAAAVYSSFSSNAVHEEHSSSQTSVQQSQSVQPNASSKPIGEVDRHEANSITLDVQTKVRDVAAAKAAVGTPPDNEKYVAPLDRCPNSQSSSDKLSFPSINLRALAKSRPAYTAKRHSSSLIIHDDSAKADPAPESQSSENGTIARHYASLPSTLRRTSSLIRLSTSADGKAKVTTGSESPSPPKIRTPRPVINLQRSQSAVEPRLKPAGEVPSSSFRSPKRLMTGRSRDARTWEFYCDSDARDALTEQAEREQKGSAAGAIGLIRSRSNKVLASNPNRRNVNTPKTESLKRQKVDETKPQKRKLNRTISSVARLQTVSNGTEGVHLLSRKPKSGSQNELLEDIGDSDKENWEPGTQIRIHRRPRPANASKGTSNVRSVLKESLDHHSQSSSHDPFLDLENGHQDDQENAVVGEEDEVTSFMNGTGSVTREPDDLDCVHNLLSLSQGAWH